MNSVQVEPSLQKSKSSACIVQRADNIKILVVDDLKENLLALEAFLRRDDVEIFKAKSGTEGLEFLISNEFALAIIDVNMPGMSGFELAELMRGTNKTKNVPIIFVTATATDRTFTFKGYESGAVDFLIKPLDTHAVKSKVNIFIQLYQFQREQNNLLEKLTKTQVELEQSLRIRDEFISIASHELNNSLAALQLRAQLMSRSLKKGDSSAYSKTKIETFTDQTERNVCKLVRIVSDMLDVARIRSGKLTLERERFDLCEFVTESVGQMLSQFLAAGYSDPKVVLHGSALGDWDLMRIEQVLVNLLTNAIKYGDQKPVEITVVSFDDHVRLTIKDQGKGIPPESHATIFKRFERAETTTIVPGLGLGLFISQEIVLAHGGKIWVESTLGEGATFVVELPKEYVPENLA